MVQHLGSGGRRPAAQGYQRLHEILFKEKKRRKVNKRKVGEKPVPFLCLWHVGQRTSLGVGLCFPLFETGLLVVLYCLCQASWSSSFWEASHLRSGTLGLQTRVIVSGFTQVLRI